MSATHIIAQNVNEALYSGLIHLRANGVESDSRNGKVIRAPGPVLTEYVRPWERLVMSPVRDANHVFHLMETLWMLAGRDDVKPLLDFNAGFEKYAQQDGRQWGAYGKRWRNFGGYDQLPPLIEELKKPDNRRAVLQMWSCPLDLGSPVKDVPCNTQVYFEVFQGRLNMTVTCRSNDVIWGAYGANAVHFSFLQEIIAHELKVQVGRYYQLSNNYHLYTEFGQGKELLKTPSLALDDFYESRLPEPILLYGESMGDLIRDCEDFFNGTLDEHARTSFMRMTAIPLHNAYLDRKAGKPWNREAIPHNDWGVAFLKWADRRDNKEQK